MKCQQEIFRKTDENCKLFGIFNSIGVRVCYSMILLTCKYSEMANCMFFKARSAFSKWLCLSVTCLSHFDFLYGKTLPLSDIFLLSETKCRIFPDISSYFPTSVSERYIFTNDQ